jgi:hypothetical protein
MSERGYRGLAETLLRRIAYRPAATSQAVTLSDPAMTISDPAVAVDDPAVAISDRTAA